MIRYSEVESKRFNLNIFRGILDTIAPVELRQLLVEQAVDLAIVRIACDQKPMQYRLLELGFPCLHADTLVYYAVDLRRYEPKPLRNGDLVFHEARAEHRQALEELVPLIFTNYQTHYFSNPLLDPQATVQGYLEWALNYVAQGEGRISWLMELKGRYVGFITCSFDSERKSFEGVLNGVHPDFEGQGIYSDTVRYVQRYFRNLGYERMQISTQVQNYGVQKVWVREGLFLEQAFDTYHINCLLGRQVQQ
jgi:GNAT superfamily N-acetyltransferase